MEATNLSTPKLLQYILTQRQYQQKQFSAASSSSSNRRKPPEICFPSSIPSSSINKAIKDADASWGKPKFSKVQQSQFHVALSGLTTAG
ncbi:hypothetical protein Nepgr_003835 [Nepenthes gracilis]|uniref:Uncharacterized protein n=1 Tax=Nepenthes gracilis TaxID=150966 RepID=A0AAD3XEI7_NEPGR|nr:hypothetical protein Nepgr_003835 [Nepenthes gracilis]